MVFRVWILLIAALSGCATLDADETGSELSYNCDDIVVIGRVVTLGGTAISDPDASLPNWRSEWRLQVQIKRVVRGSESRRTVPAGAISHANIRDDRDFLIVLTPIESGAYRLQTAALWNERPRPKLVEPCS